MSELKTTLIEAKYIDMISLGDFIVRDLGLPDEDIDGNPMPQAVEIAATIFRWAAGAKASGTMRNVQLQPDDGDDDDGNDTGRGTSGDDADAGFQEYDENGDPIMDAEEASRLEALRKAQGNR